MPDTSNVYVTRFLTTKLQPLANASLGIDALIDVGAAEWTAVDAILDDEGVGENDKLLGHSATDGTGAITRAQADDVIAYLAAVKALTVPMMATLSLLHTNLDLPQ